MKVMLMVMQMIKAFVECRVSVEEMGMWDEFVLTWTWEYMHKGPAPLDNNIQLVLVEQEKPPMLPQTYALLECVGLSTCPCHI